MKLKEEAPEQDQGSVRDQNKDKKQDVQRVLQYMFKDNKTLAALENVKGDPNEVAELLAVLADKLGLDAGGLKTIQARVQGKMDEENHEVDLAERVAKKLSERWGDDEFGSMFDSYGDDDEMPSQEEEDIERLLKQYGLDKAQGGEEEVPADIQRQMDDEFGGVEDEEEEDVTVMREEPRMAEQSEDHDYEYRARKEKEDDEEDARRRGWEQEKQDAKRKADCDESFDRFHSNKRNTRLNETLMGWAIK